MSSYVSLSSSNDYSSLSATGSTTGANNHGYPGCVLERGKSQNARISRMSEIPEG